MIHTSYVPVLFLTAIISFTLSLLAKLAADQLLSSRVPILGSFVGLRYAVNPGVAFGIQFPGPLQHLLIAVALGALLWAAVHARTRLSTLAFGMIMGGAFANVADRVFDGVVTDFVQVGTFPIFNVADSCISIGVALLLMEVVLQWARKGAKRGPGSQSPETR